MDWQVSSPYCRVTGIKKVIFTVKGVNWTTRKLPPLNALRSYEAAARHGSMTRAADELRISQVAVTRAVQLLESTVGAALFYRRGRQISLTPAGEEYYHTVQRVLDEISTATERVRRRGDHQIRLWSNGLIGWWLFPKLADFMREHPHISIEFRTIERPGDAPLDEFDGVIKPGATRWKHPDAMHLLRIDFSPVCSPAVMSAGLKKHEDLAKFPLLHSSYRPEAWSNWLEMVNCQAIDPKSGILFDTNDLCYQAATADVGIALGQLALVRPHLDMGRLIQPFPEILRTERSYFLVSGRSHRSAAMQDLVAWIERYAEDAE